MSAAIVGFALGLSAGIALGFVLGLLYPAAKGYEPKRHPPSDIA